MKNFYLKPKFFDCIKEYKSAQFVKACCKILNHYNIRRIFCSTI